jgi:hypothetical protein
MVNRVWPVAKSAPAGRPFMMVFQVLPPSVDLYIASPQNEAYRMLGDCGSMSMSVAPRSWSVVPLRTFQCTPPSVDSKMPYVVGFGGVVRRMPPRPRPTAMYRWLASRGSIAIPDVATPANVRPLTFVHVMPPSVDFITPLPK